jgi:glycosyltransferase involved in cell wall biosynthesis
MNAPPDPNPQVSVVIPVYNGEATLDECLDSVLRQTLRPIEVVCVDDGSYDHSVDIIRNFGRNVRLVRQPHGDVSRARNTGVHSASGENIAFIDQDDLWEPGKLSKQLRVFRQQPETDLVFNDLIKIGASGNRRHPKDRNQVALGLNDRNLLAGLLRKNVLMPSAVMIRRESFIRAGGFDEDFRTCGDYELWLRMAALGMKFRYVPEPLTLYRIHDRNTSKNTKTMHEDRLKAVRKTLDHSKDRPDYPKLERIGLSSAYMLGAHTFFSAGKYEEFLKYARTAIRYDKKVIDAKFISRYVRSLYRLNRKRAR